MAQEKESTAAAPVPAPEPGPALEQLLKEFATITDQAKRREFYWAHPELQTIYSTVNFH